MAAKLYHISLHPPDTGSDEMDRKAFKDLCGSFVMGLDQLRSSWQAGSISKDSFKEICKRVAEEVLRFAV